MFLLSEAITELLGNPRSGSSLNASYLCPLHDEKQPSFSINQDTGEWKCHSCGAAGGIERLARLLGEPLGDGVRHDILIRSTKQEPEPEKNFAPLANHYYEVMQSHKGGQLILAGYLRRLGIARMTKMEELSEHFRIGYNPEKNALSLPYWDGDRVPMLKYRHFDGTKSAEPGSKRSIYNVDEALGKPVVIICEGESDTHAVWSRIKQRDRVGAVGVPGANVSAAQWSVWALNLVHGERIYVGYDADAAGDKGAETIMSVLGNNDRCRRIRPTKGKDLAEHLAEGGNLRELGMEDQDL